MTKTEIKIRSMFLVDKLSTKQISEELNIPVAAIEKITAKFTVRKKSSIEGKMGAILKLIYPNYKISDQERIDNLYMDYYVKDIRLAIETDGSQHFSQNAHHHGKSIYSQNANFEHSLYNDAKKERLCKEQHIYLIRFSYDEKLTIDYVRNKINEHSKAIIENLNRYTAEARVYK